MPPLKQNFLRGTLADALDAGDTAAFSTAFAAMLVVEDPAWLSLVLDPDSDNPEIVHVIAHAEGATDVLLLRAREGTTARDHASGTPWVHALTDADFDALVAAATASAQIVFIGPDAPTGILPERYEWIQTGLGVSGVDTTSWIEDGLGDEVLFPNVAWATGNLGEDPGEGVLEVRDSLIASGCTVTHVVELGEFNTEDYAGYDVVVVQFIQHTEFGGVNSSVRLRALIASGKPVVLLIGQTPGGDLATGIPEVGAIGYSTGRLQEEWTSCTYKAGVTISEPTHPITSDLVGEVLTRASGFAPMGALPGDAVGTELARPLANEATAASDYPCLRAAEADDLDITGAELGARVVLCGTACARGGAGDTAMNANGSLLLLRSAQWAAGLI